MRAYCRSNPALPTPQSSLSCQPHYEEATRLDVEGLVITMRISTMCLHSSPPRTCTRPTRMPSPCLLFNKHYLPLCSNSPQRHPRPSSRLSVLNPRSLYLLQHPSPLLSATFVHTSQRRASSSPSEKCNASCIMVETRSFKNLLVSDARAALHRTRSVPAPRKSKHAPRELSAHFSVSRFKRIPFGSKRRETPETLAFKGTQATSIKASSWVYWKLHAE